MGGLNKRGWVASPTCIQRWCASSKAPLAVSTRAWLRSFNSRTASSYCRWACCLMYALYCVAWESCRRQQRSLISAGKQQLAIGRVFRHPRDFVGPPPLKPAGHPSVSPCWCALPLFPAPHLGLKLPPEGRHVLVILLLSGLDAGLRVERLRTSRSRMAQVHVWKKRG